MTPLPPESRFQPSKLVLGTLGYAAVTFPLAYVWHLVLFERIYRKLGYFSRDEPIIAFGFISIVMQGFLLSLIYPYLYRGRSIVAGTLIIASVMGVYHWTMHVLSEAAKYPLEPLTTWFALETTYLALQFLLAGFVISLVYQFPGKQRRSA